MLRVECDKCGRSGRYRVARLAEQIGWDGKLNDWLYDLTKDCARKQSPGLSDPCGAKCWPDMDTDLLQHRLLLVERQIVDAERHITLRRDILNGLDVNGRRLPTTCAGCCNISKTSCARTSSIGNTFRLNCAD